jgi:hypothetical protein
MDINGYGLGRVVRGGGEKRMKAARRHNEGTF